MVVANRLTGEDNMSYSNPLFFDEKNTLICDECKCVNSPYYLDKNIILKKGILIFL